MARGTRRCPGPDWRLDDSSYGLHGRISVGYDQLRPALLELNEPGNHHQRPVPVHEAPSLHRQKRFVVADAAPQPCGAGRPERGGEELRDARDRQCDLLCARARGGAPSCFRRDLRRLWALDRTARCLPSTPVLRAAMGSTRTLPKHSLGRIRIMRVPTTPSVGRSHVIVLPSSLPRLRLGTNLTLPGNVAAEAPSALSEDISPAARA